MLVAEWIRESELSLGFRGQALEVLVDLAFAEHEDVEIVLR